MPWYIVVETEDGRLERVGDPSTDLDDLVAHAISLADELGRIPSKCPDGRKVNIMEAGGRLELSIAIIPGGLDPSEA